MTEWPNVPVSKTGVPSRVPRVRIPPSPLVGCAQPTAETEGSIARSNNVCRPPSNLSRSHRSRSQSTCVGRTHRTQFTSTPTCGGWTFSREFWLAEIGGGGGDLGSCAIRPTTGWSRLSASRAGCTLATKVPLTCAPLSLCNCPLDETDVSRYPRRDTQRRRAGRFRFTRRRGRPP